MQVNTPTSPLSPEDKKPEISEVPSYSEEQVISSDTVAQDEQAEQADARKAEEIRQNLRKQPEEEQEFPEDPAVKAAKIKYQKEYLDLHHAELSGHLEGLIKDYSRQGNPEVQDEKTVFYEATLDYCIENGKLTAETIMHAIIQGIATGIIRPDHIGYYQRFMRQIPPLAYILNKKPEEIMEMTRQFKGKIGNKNFQKFYWTEILTDPTVAAQIKKSASAREWDHDFIAEIAPGADQDVAKLIATRPNAQTAIENAFVGSLKWLQENLKAAQKNAPQNVRKQLACILTLHGASIPDRAYQNVEPIEGGRFFFDDTTRKDVPRMSASLLNREKNLGQINEAIWSLIRPLEPKLFDLLKKPNLDLKELQDYVLKKYNLQINSFDDFYDNIDSILVQVLPDQKPRKRFFLTRWLELQ